jgi:hypothetical protein
MLTSPFSPRTLPGALWHLPRVLLPPLASLLSRLLRDDRDHQGLALRQQVSILQRQLAEPPRLSRAGKLALLLTSARMRQTQPLDGLMIIKPATVIGRHRQFVRQHWTFDRKRQPGRPRIDPQAEQVVLRLARESSGWGCGKTAGEMGRPGCTCLGRSIVQRILKRHGLWPHPRQGALGWYDFLSRHGQFIWACDSFTVTAEP